MFKPIFSRMVWILAIPLVVLSFSFSRPDQKKKPKVLIYSKTNGYHHASIPNGIKAIEQLGAANGFSVDATTDSLQFTDKNLKQYAAVIFLSTTANVLDATEQGAFERYIRSGKGFVGVHAAADTEYDWPWYNQLVGAYFKSHPAQQTAKLEIKDNSFIATKHLPATWERKDEWYNFRDTMWDKVHILITIDEKSYSGGANYGYHPMAWYREFDGGRSFYTALGHTEESYTDENFLKHLLGGIEYAIGK